MGDRLDCNLAVIIQFGIWRNIWSWRCSRLIRRQLDIDHTLRRLNYFIKLLYFWVNDLLIIRLVLFLSTGGPTLLCFFAVDKESIGIINLGQWLLILRAQLVLERCKLLGSLGGRQSRFIWSSHASISMGWRLPFIDTVKNDVHLSILEQMMLLLLDTHDLLLTVHSLGRRWRQFCARQHFYWILAFQHE